MKRVICFITLLTLCLSFAACGKKNQTPVPELEPENLGSSSSEVLDTKKHLYFDEQGNFKVMIFSDLRVSKTVDEKIVDNMEDLLDQEKPDFVILGGDVHDGTISNETELRAVLDVLNAPLEERKIPWCHAFGVNTEGTEDAKTGYSRKDQMKVYTSYPYCLSKTAPDWVYGVSNFVIPVRLNDGDTDPSNDKSGFNIWCLDANGYLNDYKPGFEDEVLLKNLISGKTNLDCIHYSQMLWYQDTSIAFEAYNGRLVPGLMYFQVPVYQFEVIKRNPESQKFQGNNSSGATVISASERESGIFYTCYERGDIEGIFCGYNAENDFQGRYLNMTLAFCSTIGKTKVPETAGARVVSITRNGLGMETSMAYVK
ncbi:MAG: metallophosphoesterase [Clostridia bacterium]|nr:metallophosphoesterase [Clostridia bacterium]